MRLYVCLNFLICFLEDGVLGWGAMRWSVQVSVYNMRIGLPCQEWVCCLNTFWRENRNNESEVEARGGKQLSAQGDDLMVPCCREASPRSGCGCKYVRSCVMWFSCTKGIAWRNAKKRQYWGCWCYLKCKEVLVTLCCVALASLSFQSLQQWQQ